MDVECEDVFGDELGLSECFTAHSGSNMTPRQWTWSAMGCQKQLSRLICSCYVADQTYICLLRVVKCCIQNFSIFFKEHKIIVLKESMIITNTLEESLWRMRGSAAWVIMAAVFVCGLCGSSDAVMSSVLCRYIRCQVASSAAAQWFRGLSRL